MPARLPGADFRGELRALMASAREAGKDPLLIVGTYVVMRTLSAGSVGDLAALLGVGKERTAKRRRSDLATVLGGVTDLTPPPGLGGDFRPGGVTDLTPGVTDLARRSLLSDDLTSRDTDPASPGRDEGIVFPSRGEQNSAAANLRALGVSVMHVRTCMAYALDKWPTVQQVRAGNVANLGGYLYRMVRDYAERMGYLDGRGRGDESADELVERGARMARPKRGKAPLGASSHRRGPDCPLCSEPTETDVGRCANGRCAGFLKVTAAVT